MNPQLQKIFIIFCLVYLWTNSIKSQNKWELNFNNEIDLTARFYTSPSNSNLENHQGEIRTFHDLKLKHKTNLGFHLSAKSILNINSPQRNRAWLNQAYTTLRLGSLSLKVGKQTIKWGSITGMSAMDMANRYDYYDYLSTDKEYLGIWAGKLRYNTGPLNWTLQIAETNNQSILHFDSNRWTRMPKTTTIPQDPNNIYALELESVNSSIENNSPQVSVEVDFDIKSVSTRLFAYHGSNDIPQRAIDINLIEDQNVTYDLLLKYHDLKIYGIGHSIYLSDWNIWYELSNIQNQRILQSAELAEDKYWNFTLGIDRVFTFENPEKSLKWLFQYCNIMGADNASYGPMDLDYIFANAILTEIQYTHNYNWKVDLRTVVDLGQKGLYLNPRLKHLVSDQLHLQLSSDILLGSTNSFWGHYNDNSRISFHVQYVIQ